MIRAGSIIAWRRWVAYNGTHRWAVAKSVGSVLSIALVTFIITLGVISTLSDGVVFNRVAESTAAPQEPRSAGEAAQESQSQTEEPEGELLLPLARLVEPGLPGRSWFAGDAACARYETRFGRPGALPDARLVSFFRSGNTWSRYLLEAASGLFTCGPTWNSELVDTPPAGPLPSVAELRAHVTKANATPHGTSPALRRGGFVAEDVSPLARVCVVSKTHAFVPAWRRETAGDGGSYPLPAVLLVRDPFRALISLRHFHQRYDPRLSRSRAGAAAFTGGNWTHFVDVYSRFWLDLADDWTTAPQHTLLVAYERLEEDPARELGRMLAFLGVRPEPGRLRCALKHAEGDFHNRDHPVVPDQKVYDKQAREMVWARILELNKLLTSRGYRRLPVEKYAFF